MEEIRKEFEKLFTGEVLLDHELSAFTQNVVLSAFTQNVVLNNLSKIPSPSLFRFSTADYYNIRGLETESLFLSPAGSMNDIFEGLSCEITDKIINNIDVISNLAYLKSFSEDKESLLMWAHYADSYSGMCVEYDFSKLPEKLLYHLFPVYYTNTRHTFRSFEELIDDFEKLKKENKVSDGTQQEEENEVSDGTQQKYFWLKNIMHLFLNKSKDWSYEKEWRFVVTYPQLFNEAKDLGDENDELYQVDKGKQLISIKNCIKTVYLGPKMKEDIKEHIKEICKEKLNDTPVFESKLAAKEYKLEFTKINK